jgi:hypothetical protein
MIKLKKPVKLLEWQVGTNTTNQRWEEMGQGKILSAKRQQGLTNLVVEINGVFKKSNLKDDSVKVAQLGEGIAPHAEKWGKITDRWGEVAMGTIKSVQPSSNKSVVHIEISSATKIMG